MLYMDGDTSQKENKYYGNRNIENNDQELS